MKFLIAVLLIAAVASAKVRYDGTEVWRVGIHSLNEAEELHSITEVFSLDSLAEGKDFADVLIRPHLTKKLKPQFAHAGLEHKVIIANLQDLIDEEAARIGVQPRAFNLTQYNTFADIELYLVDTAAANANFELVTIGNSYEGRNLRQMRYSTDASAGKPVIWIDCGIHAREWITPATCLYGIDRLNAADPMFDTILASYDIYIMPVNNPDGYDYTWTNDRLWRKNRNPENDASCVGTDLNRNFDYMWSVAGSSSLPCSATYHGPSAASEVETQATQAAIDGLNIEMLFSIHSYSEMWMYPWGYTNTPVPDDDKAALDVVSLAGITALAAVHGTQYVYGSIADVIYLAAGTTVDYGYGASGILHSYTLELRDTGEFGFELPEDQIAPTCHETWAGLVAGIEAKP